MFRVAVSCLYGSHTTTGGRSGEFSRFHLLGDTTDELSASIEPQDSRLPR